MKGTTHTEEERFQDELMFYGEGEKEKREMTEGKGFSDMYRNTSEELFLKSLMENSVGMPVPNMEMLGFKNISSHLHQQHHLNARIDSEELFKTWLTNGENSEYNSSSIVHRTRQASRRISTELANLTNNQPGGPLQKKRSNDVIFSQNDYPLPDTISTDLNHQSIRDAVEKSVQASNLYLAKAWFHSSQPMTRSRSSELRRRYAASMQSGQICIGNGMSNSKQELAYPMHDVGNQLGTFMSPSNSSSSTFNATPQMGDVNRVSSVVNMLKGTLEHKKLANNIDKETAQDSCNPIYHGQQIIVNSSFDQGKGNSMSIPEIPQNFQEISSNQVNDGREIDLEGFINSTNPTHQLSTVSREASQSESSAAAPVLSSGFEACDGPSNSSQTLSICESSRKQVENNKTSEIDPRAKDFRERIIENLKDDRKRGGLIRYGSVTSAGSVDKGDTTKKRRVERSRKMAEAKERISTPAIPSDMQSVLKRCENLEKEVRSLKLNLSFMNRKDSEQTKQIEELQKQNEDLADEKERLLEEIERILSETGKM